MDFLLQNIIIYILIYKYVALFIVSLLASFIIPIPSGSILMATAAFASEKYFNFSAILLIFIIGSIIGDNSSYWLARIYGERIFSHIGFRQILKSKTFHLVEKKFRRHPGFIVFASRFEVLSTLSVNLLSGIGKVPYKKYLLYESIGTVSQVLFYGSIGYFFGYNWQSADTITSKVFIVITLILLLLFINFRNKVMISLKKKKEKIINS